MEGYLAQIMFMALNFTPRNWAPCDGRLISIASNTALFSLLGTTYGGNGTTTFALPDLRGRVPVGQGSGPGLSPYSLGQMGGVETVTLTTTQIPSHTHAPDGRLVQTSVIVWSTASVPSVSATGQTGGGSAGATRAT